MPPLELSALTTLLWQIATIIVVSRLLGVVMRRLGQPLVMAEVVAGIVLGPSVFGLLWPDAMTVLFPASSLELLRMLSQVGLVLFMFLIGLELDPKLLRGRTRSSILISHTSIVFPFALGAGSAWWLYDVYSSPTVPFTAFMLFLGVSMSVTAFPVLARILAERNLLGSHVGAIAIACAAVDDVTAWCLLAFVVGVARAGALTDSLWTTGLALAFVLGMLFVVRPFLARVAARVVTREGLTSNVVAIIMLMLITSSAITELIGIHALFGAFLFGAILPKDGRLAEMLVEKLETVSIVLLLPLFFAFSGLRTEIALVSGAQDWLVTGALILVASIGKFGGSAVAARLTGLRWREASAIGILMNTRGLMELIVLNIGLDLGVISPTVFTMLVIMALVTTFATTPILRRVYPDSEIARAHPGVPHKVEAQQPSSFTLLMCVADQISGPGMATVASGLLGRHGDAARAYALHLAIPTDRPSVVRRKRETNEQAAPLLTTMARARELALDVRTLEFMSSDPGIDICRTAEAKHASMILLGWHKPLLLEGHLGGTVRKVLGRTRKPVAVLVDRDLQKLERVLVAFAGSAEDLPALRLAHQFGTASSVDVTVLHVLDPARSATPDRGQTEIDEVLREVAATPRVRVRVCEHDSPTDAVLAEAASGYDLVVVGMNAHWGLGRGMLGVGRQRILAEAAVSVLAVHPPLDPASEPASVEDVFP
jgi:Kef-type K+ transport system membrane component KefB/nucleotide-binding universal stress UspA family protein